MKFSHKNIWIDYVRWYWSSGILQKFIFQFWIIFSFKCKSLHAELLKFWRKLRINFTRAIYVLNNESYMPKNLSQKLFTNNKFQLYIYEKFKGICWNLNNSLHVLIFQMKVIEKCFKYFKMSRISYIKNKKKKKIKFFFQPRQNQDYKSWHFICWKW